MRCRHAVSLLLCLSVTAFAEEGGGKDRFRLQDLFDVEYASDPQISPDGTRVVYVRHSMDVKKDRHRTALWSVRTDGGDHRPLVAGPENVSAPTWSPDGQRLLYVSKNEDGTQIFCRWLESGATAALTRLREAPADLAWSEDGKQIAFSSFVPAEAKPFVQLPIPKGAQWADPPKVITGVRYRFDGRGYLREGHHHLFVVSAEGGTPRQVTSGPYDHKGPIAWDGATLIFAANRRGDADLNPREADLHALDLATGKVKQLTDRAGPDYHPVLSPDKKELAYLGFDDRKQGYQVMRLYILDRRTGKSRLVSGDFDRDVAAPVWGAKGRLYFQYGDQGITKIGRFEGGKVVVLAEHVGGTTMGRPYASGSFSIGGEDRIVYTRTSPQRPADVALAGAAQPLTRLNEDLFERKELGAVEEVWWKSSHDGRKVQGWILKPPGFDAGKKYPLILEIHGGPFADYGPRWAAEHQLHAAAGYVVFFANPRGSTSYGEEFGNLIHHAYPGHDYDDLMSGVDAVLAKGYVDPKRLYVTGGSGGGVLSSWTIGKTDRFRAAAIVNPVINWHSFVLTADMSPFFVQYWFPQPPWEAPEHYHKRSPLSLVGKVKTPALVLTGEDDHRTPISESEQYYQALKLRKVEAAFVRIPGSSHGIGAARPSHLLVKVACIQEWFRRWK